MRFFYVEINPDERTYFKYDKNQSTTIGYSVNDINGIIWVYRVKTPGLVEDKFTRKVKMVETSRISEVTEIIKEVFLLAIGIL